LKGSLVKQVLLLWWKTI